MMDTQRLIALVIFSFSALLLWDAWQKHNAPQARRSPASATAPSSVPAPRRRQRCRRAGLAAARSGVPRPRPPCAGGRADHGEDRPLRGRDQHASAATSGASRCARSSRRSTARKPLTLMEPDPQHYFVTQSGLLGEGLPTHKTAYDARAHVLRARRRAGHARGAAHGARTRTASRSSKRYRFHRGSYEIDVGYDVSNKSGQADRALRVLPVPARRQSRRAAGRADQRTSAA